MIDSIEMQPLNSGYNEMQEDKIEIPSNLDNFLKDVYGYYKHKGFSSYLINSLYNYLTVVYSSFIVVFLLYCFKWREFSNCRLDETNCTTFVEYIDYKNIIGWTWTLFILQIIPLTFLFITKCETANKNYKVYKKISISSKDLRTMNWSIMIKKLKNLQNSIHFIRSSMKITAMSIVGRIMRIDNYKIAIYTSNILPLGSPNLYDSLLGKGDVWYMGHLLEKNLDYIFFRDGIIDFRTFELKLITDRDLKMRFKLFAVLNLFFIPFAIMYTIINSVFEYVNELYTKGENGAGLRHYTPHSMWLFREYNELEHQFYYRMSQSNKHIENYFKLFKNPIQMVISKSIVFILSGMIFMIFIFGLMDDSVLIRVTLFERNLFWYFALFSTLVAFFRSFTVYKIDNYINSHVQMKKIASFTHMYPEHWNLLDSWSIKESFENLVPNRIVLLIQELICIICTPYILWYVLPNNVFKLLNYCKDISYYDPSIGTICKYSNLSVEKYGNYELKVSLKNLMNINCEVISDEHITHQLVSYKVEKSYINFIVSYPNDICGLHDEYGDTILSGIKNIYKEGGKFILMTKSVMYYPDEVINEEHIGGANEEIFWAFDKYIYNLKKIRSTNN